MINEGSSRNWSQLAKSGTNWNASYYNTTSKQVAETSMVEKPSEEILVVLVEMLPLWFVVLMVFWVDVRARVSWENVMRMQICVYSIGLRTHSQTILAENCIMFKYSIDIQTPLRVANEQTFKVFLYICTASKCIQASRVCSSAKAREFRATLVVLKGLTLKHFTHSCAGQPKHVENWKLQRSVALVSLATQRAHVMWFYM